MDSDRSRLRLLVPGLFLAPAVIFKIGGADIWWHLRTGRWVAELRTLPEVDPFSHSAFGDPLRYTDVAAQVLYHYAHEFGGIAGLHALHALTGLLLGVVIAALAGSRLGTNLLAVGLWFAASLPAMTMKPQTFSYLAFGALLILLRDAGEGRPGRLLFIPLLFLAWGNLHRGGTLGLFVLGAAFVAWSLSREHRRSLSAPALVTLLLGGFCLTLNPGGVDYILAAFDVTTRSDFFVIAEWQPLTLEAVWQRHPGVIALAFLWVVDRLRSGRFRPDLELLTVAGTALLAARAGRLMPFLAMAMVPGAARTTELLLDAASEKIRGGVLQFAAGGAGVAAITLSYTTLLPVEYWGAGVVESRVPVELAAFIEEHPPGGEMWNSLDLGGYLLYALAPGHRVFIDGRNDTLYSREFFAEALGAPRDPALLAAQIQRYDIGFLAVGTSDLTGAGIDALARDPGWAMVYWDDVGAVYVQRRRVSTAYLREFAYRTLRPTSAIQRALAMGPHNPDQAFFRDVMRRVERSPRSLGAHYLAALVLDRSGDSAGYAQHRAIVDEMRRLRGLSLPLP